MGASQGLQPFVGRLGSSTPKMCNTEQMSQQRTFLSVVCIRGAGAAMLDASSDGTLVDEHGRPLVFRHRRLQESYAKKHALAIALGTVLSFMAVKVGGCRWTLSALEYDFQTCENPSAGNVQKYCKKRSPLTHHAPWGAVISSGSAVRCRCGDILQCGIDTIHCQWHPATW